MINSIIILMMLEQIRKTLKTECNLEGHKIILVGVSGGPDSQCLLDMLHQLGYPLVVAHLDHQLRTDSAAEGRAVSELANKLGVPWIVEKADVKAFAEQNALSIEEAARHQRYRFLFEQAAKQQAQAVAVGHTANDQVETVLMHLLRGAGLSGLRGMQTCALPNAWSRSIPLIRPLLGVWRAEIVGHLELRGWQPSYDPSNLDMTFYRNRLRHELVPYLENLNPGVQQRLWRMANLLGLEDDVMDDVTQAAWEESCLENGAGIVAFDIQALQQAPVAIQRRLVRRAIAMLRPGLRDIDFAAIERVRSFLETPTRSKIQDLAAGIRLEMADERLWLASWQADLPGANWPQLDPTKDYNLPVPGELQLPGGWLLQTEVSTMAVSLQDTIQQNEDPFLAYADADRVVHPLTVRTRLPGERFQPLGMQGHSIKLSDFFINQGLPQRARAGWPLIINQSELVWIPGVRLAQPYAVTPHTRQLLKITLRAISSQTLATRNP